MLLFIIFLSITIATTSYSIQTQSTQPYENPLYILQGRFKLLEPAMALIYSPDENWIVWTPYQQNISNQVSFRNRSSLKDYTSVKIGQTKTQKVNTFAFSQKGDFLFVGTLGEHFYTCKFSSVMNEEDCQSSYSLGQAANIEYIETNSVDKIIMNGFTQVWIVNFTSQGIISMQTKLEFQNTSRLMTKWHPKAEKDVVIFVGCNESLASGFISIYNITSKVFYNLSAPCLYSFEVLKDGQTLLASTSQQLIQYNLSITSIEKVGTVLSQGFLSLRESLDGSIIFAEDYAHKNLQVYSLKQGPQKSSDKDYNMDTTNVSLDKIFQMNCNESNSFTTSSDGNQILLTSIQVKQFDRYSWCLNDTFYSNLQCLKCSTNCSTCHINDSLCLSCVNNSYALTNGLCLKCNNSLTGCVQCTNLSYCLSCDTVSGFVKTPSNGFCQCTDFNYPSGNVCTLCDGKSICRKCTSPTQCLTCNKVNNWQQTPVNDTCICLDYFYNSAGTCTLCDSLKTCITCANSSTCTKCDTTKGFTETPVNGNCVCPTSFTLNSGKCIACNIEDCTSCLTQNVCYECDSSASLSDGKCVKGSIGMILLFVGVGLAVVLGGVFVYCKCKNIKKKNLQESLISEPKEEETTKGTTIKPKIVEGKKAEPSQVKKEENAIKRKVEIEPKFGQQIIQPIVPKASKVNVDKHEKLVEQKQQNDEYEPSFIRNYKKLMEKSVVPNKNNQRSQFSSKLQKEDKKVQAKAESRLQREVKKMQPKGKGNSKLQKDKLPKIVESETKFDQYDERQETQKPEFKPSNNHFKKKTQVKPKYEQKNESLFDNEFKEEKPKSKEVKPKQKEQKPKPKEGKLKEKQEKSKLNKEKHEFKQETTQQKPDFSQLKGKSSLKNVINPQQINLKKGEKPSQTLGFNDIEQAAYNNELTDQEKIMLRNIRGSFGEK